MLDAYGPLWWLCGALYAVVAFYLFTSAIHNVILIRIDMRLYEMSKRRLTAPFITFLVLMTLWICLFEFDVNRLLFRYALCILGTIALFTGLIFRAKDMVTPGENLEEKGLIIYRLLYELNSSDKSIWEVFRTSTVKLRILPSLFFLLSIVAFFVLMMMWKAPDG